MLKATKTGKVAKKKPKKKKKHKTGARPHEILFEDLPICASGVKERQKYLARVDFEHQIDLPTDGCVPTKFLHAQSWHAKKILEVCV